MFKRLDNTPADRVNITIDDSPYRASAGETVAAAVLASNIHHTRTTPVSGSPRAPFCLMGVCYECLMIIDGQPNKRACQTIVTEGMNIKSQHAAGVLPE